MYKVIGVRFKKSGKIYYFDPGEVQVALNDYVIVETTRGIEYGKVVIPIKEVDENDVVLPLKKMIRVANEEDKKQVEKNIKDAQEAYVVGVEKITEHQLEMKLVDVEYTFDKNKVIFYFTAEGRIDFRNLVKDLASIFKTRIELRQIGGQRRGKNVRRHRSVWSITLLLYIPRRF